MKRSLLWRLMSICIRWVLQFLRYLCCIPSWYLFSFNSDDQVLALEWVEDVKDGMTTDCLTWKVKWFLELNEYVTVNRIHINIVLFGKCFKFLRVTVFWWIFIDKFFMLLKFSLSEEIFNDARIRHATDEYNIKT